MQPERDLKVPHNQASQSSYDAITIVAADIGAHPLSQWLKRETGNPEDWYWIAPDSGNSGTVSIGAASLGKASDVGAPVLQPQNIQFKDLVSAYVQFSIQEDKLYVYKGLSGPSKGGGAPGPLPSGTVVGPDVFGAAAHAGASAKYSRGDHDHGLPAAPTVPTAATTVTGPDTFGDSSAVGISAHSAREYHDHGLPSVPTVPSPATTVDGPDSFGDASAVGVGTDYARSDPATDYQAPHRCQGHRHLYQIQTHTELQHYQVQLQPTHAATTTMGCRPHQAYQLQPRLSQAQIHTEHRR